MTCHLVSQFGSIVRSFVNRPKLFFNQGARGMSVLVEFRAHESARAVLLLEPDSPFSQDAAAVSRSVNAIDRLSTSWTTS